MEIAIVRTPGALATLRDDWHQLAAAQACPAFDHDWFVSCAEAFYRDDDLRIVTVRSRGALVAVAPLGLEATEAGQRLGLLGARRLYEPSGWLSSSSEALEALVREVLRLGRGLVLLRVPAESPLRRALQACGSRAFVATRPNRPSLAVETTGRWDDYYASLSSRTTGNLPRLRRKAERTFGRVDVNLAEVTPPEVEAALERLIEVESSGWKGRHGSSLRDRADLRQFFLRYARRAAESGSLRLTTVSFGDTLAAAELAVDAYRRRWQLKIGYNEAVASLYPGLQLTEASIRATFERGLDAYEFLGVAEPWEERWRPVSRAYETLAVYPWTMRGLTDIGSDLGASLWRRVSRTHGRSGSA